MSDLSMHLHSMFPTDVRLCDWPIEGLLKGLDTSLEREMKDGTIPEKWTVSELQWDPICNTLYEHVVQHDSEVLAWVLLWLISDRCHGLWRIPNNGTRHHGLTDLDNWNRLMFAMRARLGVVDGWLRRNESSPYTRDLFVAYTNVCLCMVSPKIDLWNSTGSDRTMINARILSRLHTPLNARHVQLFEEHFECSLFGDTGRQKILKLEEEIQGMPKMQQNMWADIDPIAFRTLVLSIQQDVHMAHMLNTVWKKIQLED